MPRKAVPLELSISKNLYKILSVKKAANREEIKVAYVEKMVDLINQGVFTDAERAPKKWARLEQKSSELTIAFNTLHAKKHKAKYDTGNFVVKPA